MCLSLQRRAIFPHRNFKKWSEPVSFLAFWLQNVLLATAAGNFSTSQLQKVVRARQFFSILTSKCASRYSGVQFFLCPLQSYLRTCRFSEVTFRPSRHTKHWKTQHLATSLTFRACWSSFFPHLLIFFLAALLFQLSILSEVRLLNFLRPTYSNNEVSLQVPAFSGHRSANKFLRIHRFHRLSGHWDTKNQGRIW